MADSHTSEPSPLAADDPRISEWIDGRLGETEAAEIERAVGTSQELTAIVADLRVMRRAMRVDPDDDTPMDVADRVMAALASGGASGERSLPRVPTPAPLTRRRRPLPWWGLAGALAAGVLATIVVNWPDGNEREVALAPPPAAPVVTPRPSAAEQELVAEDASEGRSLEKAADDRLDAVASNRMAPDNVSPEPRRDKDLLRAKEALVDAEAALGNARDPLRTTEAQPPAPGESGASLKADSRGGGFDQAGALGGGSRARSPSAAGTPAPASAPAPKPTTPVPSKEESLADAPAAPADAALHKFAESKEAFKERQQRKRANVELAGVLVIAITSPSERRALDRLVADSGLEATPAKDHLELFGPKDAVDEFLNELSRVGLVAALPGRREVAAGKLKADKKAEAKQASLILRVVERKSKQPPAATAGEAEKKP